MENIATDIENITTDIENIIKGERSEYVDYIITLGLSGRSKGVMFVLYTYNKKVISPYVNPYVYLGLLGGDLKTACINARKRIKTHELQLWDEETMRERQKTYANDPTTILIPFGKYKGLSIAELYDTDLNYLYWLANNGVFKTQYLNDAMQQYREICLNTIITNNKAQSNSVALPIEEHATLKKLKIYNYKREEVVYYGYVEQVLFSVKLIDDAGNKYTYWGSSKVFENKQKDDEIEFKCRIAKTYESMGIVFNVLKMR